MRSFEAFYHGSSQASDLPRIVGRCRRGLALALTVLATLVAAPAKATDLPVEGGPGGSYFRLDCARDYAVGVYVRSGAWVDAVGLKCASFDAAKGTFKLPAWNTPYHGGSGGAPAQVLCPGNTYYVSGMQVGWTREGNDPKFVDYIELTCRPVGPGAEVRVCLETAKAAGSIIRTCPGSIPASCRRRIGTSARRARPAWASTDVPAASSTPSDWSVGRSRPWQQPR